MCKETYFTRIMKRIFVIVFIIFPFWPVFSQAGFGGLGFFSPGIHFGSVQDLSGDLSSLGINGNDWASAFSVGGGGFGIIGGRILIGGKGFGTFPVTASGSNCEATWSTGGGFFQLGTPMIQKNGQILFPALGIGGMGTDLEIENQSSGDLAWGEDPIPVGEMRNYEVGWAAADFSLNYHRFIGGNSQGGWTLGLSLGYSFSLNEDEWKNKGTGAEILGLGEKRFNMVYVKIALGGGGFSQ